MKKGLTELVFILDQSGSMRDLSQDTIGGFNSMIEKQKNQDGECLVSLVVFDSNSTVVYDRMPIAQVPDLTSEQYCPRGNTALIDAIGGAIHHIANVHKYAREEDVPQKTLFVITTDGMENSSTRYTADQVREMITKEQNKYGWEFLFLGANIDAVETARFYGIAQNRAVRYNNDRRGVELNYKTLSEAVSNIRATGEVEESWCMKIEEDYKNRS